MTKYWSTAVGIAILAVACEEGPTERPPERFELVWMDDFNGPAGQPPNPDFWGYDIGTGPNGDGWGNQQLDFATDRIENVALDGNGNLAITAIEEQFANRDYTSARITTEDRFTQRYGRIEALIQVPAGQGIWPAFWMLGENFAEVGLPQAGEIDIMRFRGQERFDVVGGVQGPDFFAVDSIKRTFRRDPGGPGFDEGFSEFAVEWDPSRIAWFVDGELYHTFTPSDVPEDGEWVFDRPFFLLLNLAVGGNFVGPVGDDTEFPRTMLVDYVRVYSRTD